jgi:carboxymethylenebutenolidase
MRYTLLLLLTAALALPACQSSPQTEDEDDETITDKMAEEHDGDEPTPTEGAERELSGEVEGEEVRYGGVGDTDFTGYLARPAGVDGGMPAVILIHEWWGLNDNMRSMARQLAAEGYMALAVDLYDDKVAEDPERARKLMAGVMQNERRAIGNLSAARQYIESEYDTTTTALLGWCFGGGWALKGALNMGDNIDAVVIYYGQVTSDTSQLANLEAPLLGIFAAEDTGIPPEDVREFEAALDELDKRAEVIIYDDVDHAFANPSGQNYDAEAADDAWERTLEFFEQYL